MQEEKISLKHEMTEEDTTGPDAELAQVHRKAQEQIEMDKEYQSTLNHPAAAGHPRLHGPPVVPTDNRVGLI